MPDTQRALEVYIQPPRPDLLDGAAVAVIDILRATTVHTALLAHGAEAVYPVAQWADAQRLRGALPGSRLIGEVDSLPGPGAEFGNSPTEFASLDVTGWTTIHVTGNGTRALAAAAHAPFVISACLRNLSACAAALCNDAVRRVAPIAIVCSGDHNGSTASLEDTVAAGAYVEELTRLAPSLRLDNGAMIALKLWQAYDGPALAGPLAALAALRESPHGRDLIELGFEADLAYAAEIDAESVVPRLTTDSAGHARLQDLRDRQDRPAHSDSISRSQASRRRRNKAGSGSCPA